jgi:hypothetical protein
MTKRIYACVAILAPAVLLGSTALAFEFCVKKGANGQFKENSELRVRTACDADKEVKLDLFDVLAAMSLEDTDGDKTSETIRFTGVNVQVVDGSGDTVGETNGRGNLIVGYNEDRDGTRARTGSHNVVIGVEHSYTSRGGLVAGEGNTISGLGASVTGGNSNIASGALSSVHGGHDNQASGADSCVAGGVVNHAQGSGSSVTGGYRNVTIAIGSSVAGGAENSADGPFAAVSGGFNRTAPDPYDWAAGSLLATQ